MSPLLIKREFGNKVFYELDPSQSHSTLMIEGLILKFSESFFATAVSYWQTRLTARIQDQLMNDFKVDTYTEIQNSISFTTLHSAGPLLTDKNSQLRATIICIPFMFSEQYSSQIEKHAKSWTRALRPVYIASIMIDLAILRKLTELCPLVKVVMLFCVESEEELANSIRRDGKGAPVDPNTIKILLQKISGDEVSKAMDKAQPWPKGITHSVKITDEEVTSI